ncbi:hypothetical protein WA026_012160 [Henosepilachna vigintioctopunctata]|uniref:Reverse transcriptase domain-containing protein n=1 Tax=Henosepilachna vigintioctopunctata TaxID=420089 RepID=A0AAW1V551_9CUCU
MIKFIVSKSGLIVGNLLSPLLAEILMDELENSIQINPNFKHFVFWYRYVDDIITCFTGTDRSLKNFENFINAVHPNIKFTTEIESDKSIDFLELTITRLNNKFDFSIFHKPSHTDTIIHNSSCHPYPHQMAAFQSMIDTQIN